MKAHKYWSIGALTCMIGCFYSGYQKLIKAHKHFSWYEKTPSEIEKPIK